MKDYRVRFPRLDKIKQEIRDKNYVNEEELNEYVTNINVQASEIIQSLKNKQQEIEENFSDFNIDKEYFNNRISEIESTDLINIQNSVEKSNINYPDKVETSKENVNIEITNTISSFDLGAITKERIKNKIELLRNYTDENRHTQTLRKNETTNVPQEFTRLNPDYYANTRFASTVFIPYENINKDIVLFTLKTIPVNYRDSKLKNFKMGAFYFKMQLRSDTLFADLSIYSVKLNDKEYGAAIVSDGVYGTENIEHYLKLYYSETEQKLYVCYKIDNTNQEKLYSDNLESQLYSINVNVLIGGEIDFSTYYGYTLNDDAVVKLIGIAGLNKDVNECIGPINIYVENMNYYSRSHNYLTFTENDVFGKSKIFRINTIEHDNNITLQETLESENIIQYKKASSVKKDNIGEVLIRSLESIGLKPGIVYKCYGWILVDNMFFPVEYLKLTKKIHLSDNTFIKDEKMCGLEMLFDRRFVAELSSKNSDTSYNQPCFPGISFEGMPVFNNEKIEKPTSLTEFNINTPMRNTWYGSWTGQSKNNNHLFQLTRSSVSTTFNALDNRNADIFLGGFDLTILSSELNLLEDKSDDFKLVIR